MCGICGFTWADGQLAHRMAATMRHRGPDETGVWTDGRVSLGHTRLRIIDLTSTGSQPMLSPDGRFALVFNGEIYNFVDIREELIGLGWEFRGTSDTEVLLNACQQWGNETFARLNGMWALCIYDRMQGTLTLCRDRIGVKPLYYMADGERLIFGSELKAVLEHDIPRQVNREAVDLLLSTQFVPSPLTLIEGVSKLEPRHYLTWNLKDHSVRKHSYYDIPPYKPARSRRKLQSEGLALLRDAVRLRLVADVPVGAFLSGGIDSTAIVAVMRQYLPGERVRTVGVGFDLPGLDETPYIELARQTYGTAHKTIRFPLSDVADLEKRISRAYDEPVADPSSFPTWRLCEETRKHMTVALSGDGGDEVFGGYDSRRAAVQFMMLRRIPRTIRRALHALLARVVGYRFTRLGKLAEALRVSLLDLCDYAAEIGASIVYRPVAYKRWARDRLRELLPLSRGNLAEAMLKFDIFYNRLGDNYAAKVDRMSMAHALEVRSPFLDYRFMEFASRVPVKWKLTATKNKVLLKRMLKGLVPESILHREKHGFAAPLRSRVEECREDLRAAVDELHRAGALSGEWKEYFLERVFKKPTAMDREFEKRLYFLSMWYKTWIVEPLMAKGQGGSRAQPAG